jgi:hypothetical protein
MLVPIQQDREIGAIDLTTPGIEQWEPASLREEVEQRANRSSVLKFHMILSEHSGDVEVRLEDDLHGVTQATIFQEPWIDRIISLTALRYAQKWMRKSECANNAAAPGRPPMRRRTLFSPPLELGQAAIDIWTGSQRNPGWASVPAGAPGLLACGTSQLLVSRDSQAAGVPTPRRRPSPAHSRRTSGRTRRRREAAP